MEKKVDMKKITFRNETPADYRAVENGILECLQTRLRRAFYFA